jgi:two-component system phosphate regulon sensor histidine kinase PhoR
VSAALFFSKNIFLGWVFFVLSSVILILTYIFIKSEIRKLEEIVKAGKEKDFNVKHVYSGLSEFDSLGSTINELIEVSGKLSEIRKLREQEFLTILNVIDMPVFIVDHNGKLIVYNKFSKNLMRTPRESATLQYYYEIFRYDRIITFIKEAIASEVQNKGRLEIEDSVFESLSFPFVSRSEKFTLFLLGDVTAIDRVMKMEREFISSVSHELRTPLSVIQGSLEIIENEKLIKKNGEKFVSAIKENNERIESLVSDLAKFSELEVWLKPIEQKIDLSSTVKRIYENFLQTARRKKLDFKLNLQEGIFILGDLFLIEELVKNLVNNAIRYTESGSVELSVYSNGFATFEVKDTGSGISKSDISHLFEPFFRVESSRSRVGGGSGLGLAISKRIVDLHKGKISVESKVGDGTKFTVQFDLLRKIN